ncbi:MAG: sugar phosphate isomerase/epimerase family protein, partial [Ruminiclostridium sp.]
MKISFSTLACPDYSWTEIYTMAKDLGFNGIEVRGLGDELQAIKARPFTPEKIDKTIEKLTKLGIEIPCLSCGCCLKYADKKSESLEEIKAYIALAKKLSTPYIRVLGDLTPAPDGEVDDEVVASSLSEAAIEAEKNGVMLLVETNGVYADTARLRKLLDKVGSKAVGALWDMHHPYRYMNENGQTTVDNLGDYIKFIHVKDSVMENGKPVYKLMGQGDMPIHEMLSSLRKMGYEGYISLEWVKRWSKDLYSAGVVFPQFAEYMKPYVTAKRSKLQIDNRGTGYYPWPKETII